MSDQPGQFASQQPSPYGASPYSGPPQVYGGAYGKPRSIGACIGLAIITLGIYTYVWTWKTHDDIKRSSGVGVGGALGFVIYFVISPVTYFLLASEVRQMLERAGWQSRVRGVTGLWILLPLLGPLIWFVKVQGQLNEYWRAAGRR